MGGNNNKNNNNIKLNYVGHESHASIPNTLCATQYSILDLQKLNYVSL